MPVQEVDSTGCVAAGVENGTTLYGAPRAYLLHGKLGLGRVRQSGLARV